MFSGRGRIGDETRGCEERIAGVWGCISEDAIEGDVCMPVLA